MHNCLMEKIIKDGKKEGMEILADVFDKAMRHLEEYDEEEYKELELCLHKGAYGKILSEDMAKDIIVEMKPYGMKWTLMQTKEVQKQYNLLDIRDVDFWIVMNMAYNDYHEIFEENLDMYVKYAKNFIKDEDAKEGKVFEYFTRIVK